MLRPFGENVAIKDQLSYFANLKMGMCLEDIPPVNGSQMEITKKMTVKHLFSSLTPERKSTQYCQWIMRYFVIIAMVQHLEEIIIFTLPLISNQAKVL